VFNEFLATDPGLYKFLLPLCLGYVLLQGLLIAVIAKEIREKNLIDEVRKIHFVANLMFLVFNSILTIPFFGISINVLYCNA
jgi:hypothetical protein